MVNIPYSFLRAVAPIPALKPLVWMGSSKKDLTAFPSEVKDAIGYALHLAQTGRCDPRASLMQGHLRGVVEIRETDSSGTYRAMYTTKFGGVIYVLHAFQKKSKTGIATPKPALDLIVKRLEAARRDHTAGQR